MSDETLAVLAGSICGVGAAIPTSLLILAISRRREEPKESRQAPQLAYPYPQPLVIVVAPLGYQQPAPPPPKPEPTIGYTESPRQFTVLGQGGQASRWDGPGWQDDPQ